MFDIEAYRACQGAMLIMKEAVLKILIADKADGLRNVDIGMALGIYQGYSGRDGKEVQQGHLSRIILERLKDEGLVVQDQDGKRWKMRSQPTGDPSEDD